MHPVLNYIIAAAATAALTAACSSNRNATANGTSTEQLPEASTLRITPSAEGPVAPRRPAIPAPKATIYKTAGDYLDNVPVQLSADGQLMSFPAPTDIPANPVPVRLDGGWLLSPMGVNDNTVFTTYTYAEYRALTASPSPEALLKAVIPGSRVTITTRIPMTTAEALADPAAVNRLLSTPQQEKP